MKYKVHRILQTEQFTEPSFFYNSSVKSDTACFILSGYKEFLWSIVFQRIKYFFPSNIDICIISSGLFSERLLAICKKNKWSYFCTKRNCIPLALNSAIQAFPSAKEIYKLDEDIFITRHFYEETQKTYKQNMHGDYKIGFIAPLIPVNGFGHKIILKKLNAESIYERQFEKPVYAAGSDRMIEKNSDAAIFFWGGNGNCIPHIDILDEMLNKSSFSFTICPIRFSIGAILFDRTLWEKMHYFEVRKGTCLGLDESQLCSYCMLHSYAIIVSENTAVGHFSFGPQTSSMKAFFYNNQKNFMIKEIKADEI